MTRRIAFAALFCLVGVTLALVLKKGDMVATKGDVDPDSGGHREGLGTIAGHVQSEDGAPRKLQVPDFVSFKADAESARGLPTDPQDPNYDPSALVIAMGMRASDLFAKEIRNPVWAPKVEQRIQRTLERDFAALFPAQEVAVSSECRSSTCAVQVVLPKDISEAGRIAAQLVPQWANLGTSVEVGGSSADVLKFDMAISKERRDLAVFDETMASRRNEIVRKLKEVKPSDIADPHRREVHELLLSLEEVEPRR